MLHLLKAKSKPITSDRKRKKIPILGNFGQYKESKSKAMAAANIPQAPAPVVNSGRNQP